MEKESIVAPVQIVLDAGAAARQLVTSEVGQHPGFADLHNRLGLLEVYDGRPDRAARAFREALGINPGYFWAASNLAFALVGAGHAEEALDVLDRRSPHASHPAFFVTRAALLLEADRPDEVTAILDSLDGGYTAFATHLRAMALLRVGDRQRALKALNDAATCSSLLNRLYRQRELLGPGALEKISPRQAASPIRVFPGLFELYDFFAEIYARHGFRMRALGCYEEGQILWPDPARHAWNQGRLSSWMGDATEAKRQFALAIEENPDMVDAHIALAMEHASAGQTLEATGAFERAVELRPGYADIRYQLGLAYMEGGRHVDAVEAFRAALSINPSFHFARQNLALALQRASRPDEAIVEYERMLAGGRRSADLLMNCGIALLECDQVDRAEAMFRDGIAANPEFTLIYYHLGMAYQRQGRREEAHAAWRQFLERHGQSELAQSVLRELGE